MKQSSQLKFSQWYAERETLDLSPGDQIRGTAQIDCQHEPHTLGVDIQPRKRRPGKVSRTVSASPLMLDMTVMRTSGVMAPPPGFPTRDVLPLATVVSTMDAVGTSTPFVVPPAPVVERPGKSFRPAGCRSHSSFFPCSDCRPRLPRPRCRGDQRRIRRHPFRSAVFRWDIRRKFRVRIVQCFTLSPGIFFQSASTREHIAYGWRGPVADDGRLCDFGFG